MKLLGPRPKRQVPTHFRGQSSRPMVIPATPQSLVRTISPLKSIFRTSVWSGFQPFFCVDFYLGIPLEGQESCISSWPRTPVGIGSDI